MEPDIDHVQRGNSSQVSEGGAVVRSAQVVVVFFKFWMKTVLYPGDLLNVDNAPQLQLSHRRLGQQQGA